MHKHHFLYSLLFLFFVQGVIFGQKTITLDDIWTKFTFYTKNVPGFNFRNDGVHYTKLEDNKVLEYDLRTGKSTQIILSGEDIKGQADFMGSIGNYSFSPNEDKIIISSETENIYRRSSRSNFHVYNISSKTLVPIYPKGKIMYAEFSPSGNDVAFVFENNLYSKNLGSGLITQITFDGQYNEIINGAADWVYEEEFSMSKAFFWSPEGDQIAYLKFDESKVKKFTITKYNGDLYPQYESFKYPKVGEDNSVVSVHLYNTMTGKRSKIDLDEQPNYYIPRIKWTNDNNTLSITALNRHQNHLKLYSYDAAKEKIDVLIEEKSNFYIDIHDNLLFLPDNKHFIWSNDQSGYHHLYLYNLKSKEQQLLTKGDYEVTAFYGYDPKRKVIYFQSSVQGPEDRQVCKVDLKSNNYEVISNKKGWNSAQFNNTFDYYTITYSNINIPPTFTVFDHNGQELRIIEDNDHIHTLQKAYNTVDADFFELETSEKVRLKGWMIKPPKFDPAKKYPLFMFVYGGPGSQQVTDRWKGDNYWWFQLLAEKGYIVACVDNRGTGGRGEEFRKMTYLQLGHYETKDQIEAAMYLGRQAYVDAERIGIFGWSYGGFMATNALLKGSEVFKAGIAVAPVTNWKWYDSIYTERYMKTVTENPEGYRLNSPVNYADRLRGAYLLVHGIGDDNVHFQHSAEMMNALIKANKQYETYSYPNRNHGIYGDNARLHLYTKMTDFIMDNI